jgi:hypothetical protein
VETHTKFEEVVVGLIAQEEALSSSQSSLEPGVWFISCRMVIAFHDCGASARNLAIESSSASFPSSARSQKEESSTRFRTWCHRYGNVQLTIGQSVVSELDHCAVSHDRRRRSISAQT